MTEKTAPVRIAPLPKGEWAPDLAEFMAAFRAAVVGEKSSHPAGANLVGTLAVHPDLMKAFLTFNGHLLYGTRLSDRYREIIVLRVATLQKCAYEWAQHALLAESAGLQADEITRVSAGPDSPGLAPFERALLQATDQLLTDGVVADATWNALAEGLDQPQLMDVVFTVGTYSMLAMAMRSFGIVPDEDLLPYLPESPTGDHAR